ncbi:MAG: hypothetical protein E7600_01210 [Ruminococcaceae bacterium]|nr:hypothetical protein [Oscillospiraceae bacterium]
MSGKPANGIKSVVKTVLHICLILVMCVYIFFVFTAGPYDDHYISQKVISPYRLEMSVKACLAGGVFNSFVAWLSFKKSKVFSVIYMILGSVCFARLVWLLTL